MKPFADPHATEVLNPVAPITEKLNAVPQATEVLTPVSRTTPAPQNPTSQVAPPQNPAPENPTPQIDSGHQTTEKLNPVVAAIPAQRQDSRPAPSQAQAFTSAAATHTPHRSRWEHLPTERHPREAPPVAAPDRSVPAKQRWQRSAVTVAPEQGTLAAAGFAACDYLIRTVSILGLLAVVGMVSSGTSQTHAAQERTPGTTVATAPAHQGSFSSTHHQR